MTETTGNHTFTRLYFSMETGSNDPYVRSDMTVVQQAQGDVGISLETFVYI